MSGNAYDVVVIGAGIVGAACADECVGVGMRDAVVDADMIGGGATAAGMGHIVVMDDSDAQFALTRARLGDAEDQASRRCETVFGAVGFVLKPLVSGPLLRAVDAALVPQGGAA